jgi:hypothetical protein
MSISKTIKYGGIFILAGIFTVSTFFSLAFTTHNHYTTQDSFVDIYKYEWQQDIRQDYGAEPEAAMRMASRDCQYGRTMAGTSVPCQVLETQDTEELYEHIGSRKYEDSGFENMHQTTSSNFMIPWIVTGFFGSLIVLITRSVKSTPKWIGAPLLLAGGIFALGKTVVIQLLASTYQLPAESVSLLSNQLAYMQEIGGITAGAGLILFFIGFAISKLDGFENLKIVVEKTENQKEPSTKTDS